MKRTLPDPVVIAYIEEILGKLKERCPDIIWHWVSQKPEKWHAIVAHKSIVDDKWLEESPSIGLHLQHNGTEWCVKMVYAEAVTTVDGHGILAQKNSRLDLTCDDFMFSDPEFDDKVLEFASSVSETCDSRPIDSSTR